MRRILIVLLTVLLTAVSGWSQVSTDTEILWVDPSTRNQGNGAINFTNPANTYAGIATTGDVGKVVQTNGSTPMAYLDVSAPSTAPGAPTTGLVRLYSQTTNGQEALYWEQSDGGKFRVGRDLIHTVINKSGLVLSNGVVVCWTNTMTETAHHAMLARADAALTMPGQGVVVNGNIAIDGSGTVMWQGRTPTGYLSAANAALDPGTRLYVSPTAAGELTATVPQSPNYAQVVGFVSFNGAMDVRNGSADNPQVSTVYRTWQLWSGSNSVMQPDAKALRTLDYGSTGVGAWTSTVVNTGSNYLYVSGPSGAGLTELRSGLYRVTANLVRSGGTALSMAPDIYIWSNGTHRVVYSNSSVTAQSIGTTPLEYIWSLNITNDVTMYTNESVEVRFRVVSATVGGGITLVITTGYLDVPVPSSQFTLQSEFNTHTGLSIESGAHGGAGPLRNAAVLTNWPTRLTEYSIVSAVSNNITLNNGPLQYLAVTTATCTIHLPARDTNYHETVCLTLLPGTSSVSIATNWYAPVLLATNPAFSIQTGVTNVLLFDGPYRSTMWQGWKLGGVQ